MLHSSGPLLNLLNNRQLGITNNLKNSVYNRLHLSQVDFYDTSSQISDLPSIRILGVSPQEGWIVAYGIGEEEYIFISKILNDTIEGKFLFTYKRDTTNNVTRTYFSPNESLLIANIAIVKKAFSMSAPDLSYSGEVIVDAGIPYVNLHFRLEAAIIIAFRAQKNRRLEKSYLTVYRNGFILNTGINLINISFIHPSEKSEIPTVPVVENGDSSKTGLGVDIGALKIMPNSGCYAFTNKTNRKSVLNVRYTVVNIEKAVFRYVSDFFKKIRSPVFKGVIDYESDVLKVDGDEAHLSIIACCDFVGKNESEEGLQGTILEFLLFDIRLLWNFARHKITRHVVTFLRKVPAQNAYRNTWYPLKEFPCDKTMNNFYIKNDDPTEDFQSISSLTGGFRINYDQHHLPIEREARKWKRQQESNI